MQVDRSGRKTGVAQQPLHDGDLHARLQQVRGEAVAQAMNAALIRQLGSVLRMVKDPLARRVGQRLVWVASEEEPLFGTEHAVVVTQLLQQPRREQRVTILTPLALLNPDLQA